MGTYVKLAAVALLLLFSVIIIDSCKKPEPAKVLVTVVIEDSLGDEYKVEGATVKLYSKPNGSYIDPQEEILDQEQITNPVGVVEFLKENDCILNLTATFLDEENNIQYSGKGIGIFKLEEVYETKIEMH